MEEWFTTPLNLPHLGDYKLPYSSNYDLYESKGNKLFKSQLHFCI